MKTSFVTLFFCLAVSGAWATFPLSFFHVGFLPPQTHFSQPPPARFGAPFFDFPLFRRGFLDFPQPPNFVQPARFNYYEYPQPQRFPTFPEYMPRPLNNPQGPLVQYIYQQTALNPVPSAVELPMKNEEPVLQVLYKPEITTEAPKCEEATKPPMNLGLLPQPMEGLQNIDTQSLLNPTLVSVESLEPIVPIYNKFGEEQETEKLKPVESTTNSINSALETKPEESTTNSVSSASEAKPAQSTTNSINPATEAKPEESTTNSINSAAVTKPEKPSTNSASEAKPEASTASSINSTSETKPEESGTNSTSKPELEEPTKPTQEKEADVTPQSMESNKSDATITSEESMTTVGNLL